MKERLKFIIAYYLTPILLFVPLRLLFLALNSEKSYGATDYLNVAFHGLQLDVAVAGYVTALPLLLCIATIFVKLPFKKILLPYNIFMAVAIALAFIADASLYPFWGFKLDSTFLQYIDSPENALTSPICWLSTRRLWRACIPPPLPLPVNCPYSPTTAAPTRLPP